MGHIAGLICGLSFDSVLVIRWHLCTEEDASGLKMLVYGEIARVDVPFPLDNPDACKDSNITCPIKKNQAYSYRNHIFVKTSYPSVRNLSCFIFKIAQ